MRSALAIPLLAALLGGCASHADLNPDGTWINQNAIDAAVKGGNLRQALLASGPNLEWQIDTKANQVFYSNGFEVGEGKIASAADGKLHIDFYGNFFEDLTLKGDHLVQSASESSPEQHFEKPETTAPADAPAGSSFEKALYEAYMGGKWTIVSGDGQGNTVQFMPDGSVQGLPDNDRYALCLAGDCAAMSGEYDSMWLEKAEQGAPWIFARKGKQLEIFQAVNNAGADEMPELRPGQRRWVLEQQ
ncbi:MAG: lipoprotein [Pseudomonas sp.]|nr:lipoprotein [Pseudomonas sp.]